jgi:hypothetical protein
MFFPDIEAMDVFTVAGKNPANSGRAVSAISAILSISILFDV